MEKTEFKDNLLMDLKNYLFEAELLSDTNMERITLLEEIGFGFVTGLVKNQNFRKQFQDSPLKWYMNFACHSFCAGIYMMHEYQLIDDKSLVFNNIFIKFQAHSPYVLVKELLDLSEDSKQKKDFHDLNNQLFTIMMNHLKPFIILKQEGQYIVNAFMALFSLGVDFYRNKINKS